MASPGRPVCRCAARLTFACVLGRVFGLPQATEPPSRRSAFAYCSSDQEAIANPGCAAACVLYSCLCRLLLWPPRCGCAPGFSTICGWASTPGALSVIGRSQAWYELISWWQYFQFLHLFRLNTSTLPCAGAMFWKEWVASRDFRLEEPHAIHQYGSRSNR